MLKLATAYISLKFKIIMGEGREESVVGTYIYNIYERIKNYFDAPFFQINKNYVTYFFSKSPN